jgi:hypothetical protein
MHGFLASPFWDWLAVTASGIGLVAALAFVTRYWHDAGSTWWRHLDGTPNLFGRFLMIRKILLSGLFLIILSNRFAPGWEGRRALTAILLFGFALHTFVPYRLLSEAQKARHNKEDTHV